MILSLDDVTAYYIVKNEDMWVRQSIETAKEYLGNILVVDTGSEDNTIEEVKATGVKLIEHGPISWELFSKVKNKYLIEDVTTPLVLFLDGNEIMTPEGFKWIQKALKHVDLSNLSLDPSISIPQYDVFDLTKKGDSVVVGYYDLVRGRRRLCFKDRIAYRRGFGKSVLGRKDPKDNSEDNVVFGPHISSASGLFWHMRYLGQSSMDAELEDTTRRVRNAQALEHWKQYPQKFKTCPSKYFYTEKK